MAPLLGPIIELVRNRNADQGKAPGDWGLPFDCVSVDLIRFGADTVSVTAACTRYHTPRGDYMKTGKNASQGISWPKGTLILLGAVLLAVFLGFMLTNVAWNLAVLRQSLVGLIVGGVVLGLLIPFLLGMMVEKWAWLLGASYGVMYAFGVLYLPFFIEEGRGAYGPFAIVALVIVAVASLVAHFAQFISARRSWKKLNLSNPRASVSGILAVAFAVAVIAVPVVNTARTTPSKVLSLPKYGVQMTKSAGWDGKAIHQKYVPDPTTIAGNRNDPTLIPQLGIIGMNSRLNTYKGGEASANLYVFDQIPFTGQPLSELGSRESVYAALKAAFASPPKPQYSSPTVAAYAELASEYRGIAIVDGAEGLKFFYIVHDRSIVADLRKNPYND
jgi:hypothetical protein